MNFQNKTTVVEYDNGTFVVHTRIIDITKYTKTTIGCIKEDLYNFSRNEESTNILFHFQMKLITKMC